MDYERAKTAAAKLIAARMYTCSEVSERLLKKGFDEEVVERVISDFLGAGLLDDEEYAKMYIHDAVNVSLKGLFRAKQELKRKGVAQVIIERAARDFETDEMSGLIEYIKMRFSCKEFADRRELEKAKAHLVRRGYNIYDINKAFEKLDIRVRRGDID